MKENGKLRTIDKADLFRLKFLESGQLSPDAKHVAYAVGEVHTQDDGKVEQERSALWLMRLETGEARQLTNGQARDLYPQWSPDSKQIAFISTRADKPQVYVIAVDGGEARALTSLKQGVDGIPSWSYDGQHIAFTAGEWAEQPDLEKPFRVTRKVYRFDKVGYLDGRVQDLYIVPAAGGEPRKLVGDGFMNTYPQWSPDGKEILYLAAMGPDSHRAFQPTLRIVNVVDGSVRSLISDWGDASCAAWLPDGNRIAFVGQPFGLTIGSKSDLWLIDRRGGKPECRTKNFKIGVGGTLQGDMPVNWQPTTIPITNDGKFAYVPVQEGGTVQVYRVALSGPESCAPVLGGERTCFLIGAGEQHLAYFVSTINNPSDLYVAAVDGGNERRLTHLNDELLSARQLPTVEYLQFHGTDGVPVEGWIMKPPTGAAPYPTILYIHGGPHGAFGHMFHFDTQMLCGAGYAVLMVNHRASTGYGDEFSTAIKGDWGNLDYGDLMAGVDHAIERGLADPDRLGVCGLSGGGNLSCWVVGQTDRFKAAVPENPVTNWVSFYGVSDIGVWFAVEQMGGHPHEIPEVYAKCSPITYAHRCKTPTLLVQAEHDWRCPAEQSEQFYAVLKANGCTVEMLRLPKGYHGTTIIGAPINRRVHNEALLDWMDRYVMGKAAEKSQSLAAERTV
jgi:dipeptidyl aminopeptidase/acylaminoacyl peptidase